MKRNRNRFDQFSRHEVYDRASVVLELFCRSVAEHPMVAGDKELSAEAEKVSDAIYEFYNKAASRLMAPATKKMGVMAARRRRNRIRSGTRGTVGS